MEFRKQRLRGRVKYQRAPVSAGGGGTFEREVGGRDANSISRAAAVARSILARIAATIEYGQ